MDTKLQKVDKKYKLTVFQNRYKSEGVLSERTFEQLYLGFKNKVKRTREKYNEYVNADRNTKLTIKDVGGFIGGETEGNKRINGIRIKRQLLTLDIDTKMPNVIDYLKRNIQFYCIIHSTHSHSADQNRYRIIAPLSREVNQDEYEALGRRIAYSIENTPKESFKGLFDETTFQANRLMFFPSVSADGEYICELLNLDMFSDEQPIIDVDDVLDQYLDRNDIYEWFKPEKINTEQIGKNTLLNKKPLKAKGLVGAFNRTYRVSRAIERFLPNIYKQERNGRYTYCDGDSYGGGILLNNDTLFYSHHGTDPANLFYRSAFDLVRIHLFGNYDTTFTPEKEMEQNIVEKTDSFQKMIEMCRTLPEVVENSDSNIALKNRLEQQETYVDAHFDDLESEESGRKTVDKAEEKAVEKTVDKEEENEVLKEDKTWLVKLEGVKSKVAKLDIIFSHDKTVGKLFYFDTFRDNICLLRKPYWHKVYTEGIALTDKDMAHIRVHLDKVYDIRGEKSIDDAIIVEADKIQVNKVIDWMDSLKWDGKERIEFFFNEFFKVPLNPFTRVAFKHWLVGAVSRIYKAGSPMDLLLIIKGQQGIGKSLFFKKMATMDFKKPSDHLYSDTKIDFNKAKDSYEQLEGVWIYEWKELAGMSMSDQESIKAFVDKTEDKFRRSYGRRNVELKRRVAFGGTTNDSNPLRDRTGNRRFLVMESPLKQHECYIKDMTKFTQEYRDQLLAEAIHLYKNGFDIFQWTKEELEWWEKSNQDNLAENDFKGVIGSYLDMKRPQSWYSMTEEDMRAYMDNWDFDNERLKATNIWNGTVLYKPTKICLKELWRIALGNRDHQINRYHRELIVQALQSLGWEKDSRRTRFGVFGLQQQFLLNDIDDDELPF